MHVGALDARSVDVGDGRHRLEGTVATARTHLDYTHPRGRAGTHVGVGGHPFGESQQVGRGIGGWQLSSRASDARLHAIPLLVIDFSMNLARPRVGSGPPSTFRRRGPRERSRSRRSFRRSSPTRRTPPSASRKVKSCGLPTCSTGQASRSGTSAKRRGRLVAARRAATPRSERTPGLGLRVAEEEG